MLQRVEEKRLRLNRCSISRTLQCASFSIYQNTQVYPCDLLLCDLHWLPVAARIRLKKMVLAFNAVNRTAPIYLQTLVRLHAPARKQSSLGEVVTLLCSGTSVVEQTPDQCQESRMTLNLLQKTQNSLVKTSPRPSIAWLPWNWNSINQIAGVPKKVSSLGNWELTCMWRHRKS